VPIHSGRRKLAATLIPDSEKSLPCVRNVSKLRLRYQALDGSSRNRAECHLTEPTLPSRRTTLGFLLFPFWLDTLEPLMFSMALGSVFGSAIRTGAPKFSSLLIVLMSYLLAITTRWKRRSLTCR
jgi:hypothetical protein